MCRTNYSVTFVYDGVKSAKEVLTDAIIAQVRRKVDSDMEIIEGKEYNTDNTQEVIYPSLSGLCG